MTSGDRTRLGKSQGNNKYARLKSDEGRIIVNMVVDSLKSLLV